MRWTFNFYATPAELAAILVELAAAHELRFFGGPRNVVEAPLAEACPSELSQLERRLAASRNPVWIAGPWSIHPLAFKQLPVGPNAGLYIVDPTRGGPHFTLTPPGNDFLGSAGLELWGTYAFDPLAVDGHVPDPSAAVDAFPPTPALERAFEDLVGDVRARLVLHERPGGPVWTGATFAREKLGHIGVIALPTDGIQRGTWVPRPSPRAAPAPPNPWPSEQLRPLSLGGEASTIEAEFPEGTRVAPDEATLRSSIARIDGRARSCLVLRVITRSAARALLVHGGRGDRLLVRWIDGTDGADEELQLLDLSSPNEHIEQLDEHGHRSFVPRAWCVDRATALRAAIHFARTGAPDPELAWSA